MNVFALEAIFAWLPLAKVSFAARIGDNVAVGFVVAAGLFASRNPNHANLLLNVIVVARRWSRWTNVLTIFCKIMFVARFSGGLRLLDVVHEAACQRNSNNCNKDARIEPR